MVDLEVVKLIEKKKRRWGSWREMVGKKERKGKKESVGKETVDDDHAKKAITTKNGGEKWRPALFYLFFFFLPFLFFFLLFFSFSGLLPC